MKTSIDIDIANINLLLQHIAEQYIDLYPCLHLAFHFPSIGSLDLKLVGTGLNDLSVYKDFPLEGEDFERSSLDWLVMIHDSLIPDSLVGAADSFQESLDRLLPNAVPYQYQDYLLARGQKPVN